MASSTSKAFSVNLNDRTYPATYTVTDDVITVVCEQGKASASAADESHYAIAISLLFGILRHPK